MNERVVEIQQQVRNNSEDLQGFLRDLGQWTKQMEIKDEQLRKKKNSKNAAQAPRSVDELKRKVTVQTETKKEEKKTKFVEDKDTKKEVKQAKFAENQPKKEAKKTKFAEDQSKPERISSFDYNAWSKFDVEKELEKLDKSKPVTEKELIDMDLDMRLQKAVVEKDKGNDHFKVNL